MAEPQRQQTQTQEQNLKGRKVAILVTDGFEQVELHQRGSDLFSRPPVIERIEVLACKLP